MVEMYVTQNIQESIQEHSALVKAVSSASIKERERVSLLVLSPFVFYILSYFKNQ